MYDSLGTKGASPKRIAISGLVLSNRRSFCYVPMFQLDIGLGVLMAMSAWVSLLFSCRVKWPSTCMHRYGTAQAQRHTRARVSICSR